MNCAEYVQIRLEMQLAQAQLHAPAQLHRCATDWGSAINSSAGWQDMVRDPQAHDRKERAKNMAADEVTKATLPSALDSIQETYIAVSDQDGRRVPGRRKNMDGSKDIRRRQQISDSGLSHGSIVIHTSPPVNGHSQRRAGLLQDQSPNRRAPKEGTLNSRSGQHNGLRRQHTDRGTRGGHQKSITRGISRMPLTDNALALNAENVTTLAYSKYLDSSTIGQASGRAFLTVGMSRRQDDDSAALLSPNFQQNSVQDSASIIGGLGFEEELSQALRRCEKPCETRAQQQAAPRARIEQSPTPVHDLGDGGELLISFGTNGPVSVSAEPETSSNGQDEYAELHVYLGP